MGATRFHRRLAEACLRLAQQSPDPALAARYGLMAQDYLELADGGAPTVAPTDSAPPDGWPGRG
jgi:hypothetical protein